MSGSGKDRDDEDPEGRSWIQTFGQSILLIGAIAGIAAIGIAIRDNVSNNEAFILAELDFFLALTLMVSLGSILLLRRKLQRARSYYDKRHMETMLHAVDILREQPPKQDHVHQFTQIIEEYIIHGESGSFNWVLEGFNATDNPSEAMVVKLSGDAPSDFVELNFHALDLRSEETVMSHTIMVDNAYLKVVSIQFPAPLSPAEYFKIRVSCHWDNIFPRVQRNKYVFFNWSAYAAKGVDRHVCRLKSDRRIIDFTLETLAATTKEREKSPIEPSAGSGGNGFALEWLVTNSSEIYLLTFILTNQSPRAS